MNHDDEEQLRQFHEAQEKSGRLIVECVRYYMYWNSAAAALSACVAITCDNGKFDAAHRQDLRFHLIEQVWQGASGRWAMRVMRRSSNEAVDGDVRDGRVFFEGIAKALGGSYEGASPCYSEIIGVTKGQGAAGRMAN